MISDRSKILSAYDTGRIRKILLIRISRLGDLLFTTPAIRALKARFPRAELHFLTNPYSGAVLAGNPYLDTVHFLDRKQWTWRFFRSAPVLVKLREEKFDLAIPLRWRDEYLALFKKIAVPMFYSMEGAPSSGENKHQVDRLLDGLAPLEAAPDALGMEVFTHRDEAKAAQVFLQENDLLDKNRIVLHAGCHQTLKKGVVQSTTKRAWPLEYWISLVRELAETREAPPILAGFSRGDLSINQAILAGSGVSCPLFTDRRVGVFAALLRRAKGFVCLDSGPLHVSSAAGVPTVALFGPSRPYLTGPYRNRRGAVVLAKKIWCSPCKGKKIKCENNICMQGLSPREVADALYGIMDPLRPVCSTQVQKEMNE